jgi:hypothetical protein
VNAGIIVYREEQAMLTSSPIFLTDRGQHTTYIPPWPFRLRLYFIGGLCFALPLVSAYLVWDKVNAGSETTVNAPKVELQPTPILVRYTSSPLPIVIPAGSIAYVLQLNPNITRFLFEERNEGTKQIIWPPSFCNSLDSTIMCDFTNNQDRSLMDFHATFKISFYSLKEVKATVKRSGKHGSLKIPIRGSTGLTFSMVGPAGEPKTFTQANLLSSHNHEIVLPQISPHATVRVYLINQSRFVSNFVFPETATSIVDGSLQRIPVKLIRPQVNVEDTLSLSGLPPATYHWVGVPDAY